MPTPVFPKSLMPRPTQNSGGGKGPTQSRAAGRVARTTLALFIPVFVFGAAGSLALFSLPLVIHAPPVIGQDAKLTEVLATEKAFPVSVNPRSKTITENPRIEKLLATKPTTLGAAAGISDFLNLLAVKIASIPVYRQIAGAAGITNLYIQIPSGTRTEQVGNIFGNDLGWSLKDRATYAKTARALEPSLRDGSVVPGIYFASVTSPKDVAALTHERFQNDLVEKYGTSTEQQVPLKTALTIASLIQREAGGWDDMRLISGIIWNRIFVGMKLQIDATLQYAEANGTAGADGWWPSVEPKDKYIASAYNTYQHAGLPPGPIANPSLAAVLAALNPKKTDCLFYFHDSSRGFHCSPTYAEHVAELKQYYGRGK
jgi:cell division protein YceG involved in septum cleavage